MSFQTDEEVRKLWAEVHEELLHACENHGRFHSAHEGIAVIREEYLELEAECFKKRELRDRNRLRREAVQTAAMAIRFALELT